MENKTVVFALTSSVGLANEIVSQLGIPLGQCDVKSLLRWRNHG